MLEGSGILAAAVAAMLLPLLGWFAGRLLREIDGKADRSELAAVLELVKRQQESSEQSRERMWQQLEKLGGEVVRVREGIARLEGPK